MAIIAPNPASYAPVTSPAAPASPAAPPAAADPAAAAAPAPAAAPVDTTSQPSSQATDENVKAKKENLFQKIGHGFKALGAAISGASNQSDDPYDPNSTNYYFQHDPNNPEFANFVPAPPQNPIDNY
jgi:hypothetical protein